MLFCATHKLGQVKMQPVKVKLMNDKCILFLQKHKKTLHEYAFRWY